MDHSEGRRAETEFSMAPDLIISDGLHLRKLCLLLIDINPTIRKHRMKFKC